MATTRKAIIEKAARRIGGKTGAISSGTATTVVLDNLVNTTGDDNAYKNWVVWMMEAATGADDERLVTAWTDLTGTATIATRSDTTYTSENFVLVPPGSFSLGEWRSALDDMLLGTKRSVWNVTKTVADQLYYSLANLTSVRTHEDVVAVYRRNHTPTAAAGSFEAFDFTENYLRYPLKYRVVDSGGVAYLELRQAQAADQELVVVTREPYTALATDATTTTCPDSVSVPGLLFYLARIRRKGVDRERWDAIESRLGREYAVASRSLQQLPTPEPQHSVVTRGA